ncbi:LytTR family DNA-binding domain-containing protein [Clostridium perfringens]|nr:LytTR family DNA-binding domain-containing protein [Clostridium perfringens]MDM0888554.1 LytTR family DNA-binding domain-containing protein [Clostridium perfringens]MDM0900325.1 LytTR family DNA-binding domain-containing protein [Clostridium perfringens]MDM0906283.1 LytTR family DNA-binding domain-containing protein [Clostridium perfringens]MDM0909154.1 LytTR family DNA-binding domain-containing protein [Clostridium perfringens]
MLSIAICDDEKIPRIILKEMLKNICNKNNIDAIIDEFSSGIELLNIYKRNTKKYSIVFCDIIMKEMNGIELLRKLGELDVFIQAILITGSEEYVFQGYDVGALNYLMKPVSYEKLEKELFRAIKNLNFTSPSRYAININGKTNFIDLSEVLFFEVNNKTITANLEKESIDFNMKIATLEEELKSRNFLRCHRSYLVNISHIDSILQNKIILKNSVEIPVGRVYKKELKTFLMNRIGDM